MHFTRKNSGWCSGEGGSPLYAEEGFLLRVDPVRTRTYFGGAKGFSDIKVLTEVARDGVPVEVKSASPQLTRPLLIACGNHSSIQAHGGLV